MKYQQPYGISDPNAPYINGNPSTGTMGSIPPAASIEHPQREIANFITDTGGNISPSELDLHQLAKSVQAGGVNYGDDVGTANQLVVNLVPPPNGLRKGLHIFTTIKNNNYAGISTTLNLNSLGPKEIHHLDHTPLEQDELKAGTLALFCYDGEFWQWVSAPYFNVVTGALTANKDYYVNPVTGLDTNNGTISSKFKTINHAVKQCIVTNLNGYNIIIHCDNGTYPENITLRPLSGNGMVYIEGNDASPMSCIVNPGRGPCFAWGSIFSTSGWAIHGFRVTSTGTPNPGQNSSSGFYGGFGAIAVWNMDWGPVQYAHIAVTSNCKLTIYPGLWRVSGGAVYHILIGGGSEVLNHQTGAGGPPGTTEIVGSPVFTFSFLQAQGLSILDGKFGTISGSLGAGACKRYYVSQNSLIITAGGANYLPGNVAGEAYTGGLYA